MLDFTKKLTMEYLGKIEHSQQNCPNPNYSPALELMDFFV
jgi:hypothetical protein